MSVSIIINDANFTETVGQLGVPYGPSNYYVLGIDESSSTKSSIIGGEPSSVVGNPIYHPTHAEVTRYDGFKSSDSWEGVGTYFVVCVQPASPILIASRYSETTLKSSYGLYYTFGKWMLQTQSGFRDAASVTPDNGEQFAFTSIRVFNNGDVQVDFFGSSGRVTSSGNVGNQSPPPAANDYNFRIGTSLTGNNPTAVAAAGTYNKPISDEEILNLYEFVKSDLKIRRGLDIL